MDLNPIVGSLPAKDRFDGVDPCAASQQPLKGDFNSDSKVNNTDFLSFKAVFKSIVTSLNAMFDLNADNSIDVRDLGVLMSGWLP